MAIKYFLYLWNPNVWHWADLDEAVEIIARGDEYLDSWTCGPRKDIEIGDKFFLMKLGNIGANKKGIAGCGTIIKDPKFRLHWDESRAQNGEQIRSTDIKFEVLSQNPIISLDYLKDRHPSKYWTPRNSGTIIPPHIGEELYSFLMQDSAIQPFY